MPEMAMIPVPAAENDSYWLDVEVPTGSPGFAGYLRAVVVRSTAGTAAHEKAKALAGALGVPVHDDQMPGAHTPAQNVPGIEFSHPADERFQPPFSQGANEGNRRPR